MLDRFFHELIEKEWKVKKNTLSFIDGLFWFCALFFSVYIRNILGYEMPAVVVDFLLAFIAYVLSGKEIRRRRMAFTTVLFFPPLLIRKMAVMQEPVWQSTAPDLYRLIGMERYEAEYTKVGIIFFAFFVCTVGYYILSRRIKKEIINNAEEMKCLLLLGTEVLLLGASLMIPQKNADLFLAACFPAIIMAYRTQADQRIYYKIATILAPVMLAASTFASYTFAYTHTTAVPIYIYSFLNLLVLVYYCVLFLKQTGPMINQENESRVTGFIYIMIVTIFGVLIRYVFRGIEAMDYTVCLKPWVDEFKAGGSFSTIAGDFYNYTPPYMYILYIISRIPTEPLYPIKIVSTIFDFLLAVYAGKIVLEVTGEKYRGILTYASVFCLPTVFVNSGLWGQCDSIYVAFILMSIYCLYKEKSHCSMLCYGIAFAFKLQTLFVFPMYVFLWVKKKYRIEQFLYIPFVYIVACIPSYLAGKSLEDLLLVYVQQGNTEPWMLSWNWPNIYLLFGPMNFFETYRTAGVIGTLIVLMMILYYMVKKAVYCDRKTILKAMFMFSLVVPYFLPYMHERYGFLADVLAVMLVFVQPKLFGIAVVQVLLSVTAYTGYLHGGSEVPQTVYCFVMTALLIVSIYEVMKEQCQ